MVSPILFVVHNFSLEAFLVTTALATYLGWYLSMEWADKKKKKKKKNCVCVCVGGGGGGRQTFINA